MSFNTKNTLGVLLSLAPAIAIEARCEIYMTDADAAKAIFPGPAFQKKNLALTDSEVEKIEKATDQKVRSKNLIYFRGHSDRVVFIDQVLGKHEFITYAVGVDPKGGVAGIEILEYRESYGQQVRGKEWRAQFVGKTLQSPLKLDHDIKNISGATLSSSHVTAGVKRILETYDQVKARI